jgi:hypothetical protein
MARITLKTPRKIEWLAADTIDLMIGSEGAADLASSSPAGGTAVASVAAWDNAEQRGGLGFDPLGEAPLGYTSFGFGLGEGELGYGALGLNDAPRVVIEADYYPADKCAALPVGLVIRDTQGNRSDAVETIAQLADPPRGIRNLVASATANPNEVQLAFTESPDIS